MTQEPPPENLTAAQTLRIRLQAGPLAMPELLQEKSITRHIKGQNRVICKYMATNASALLQSALFSPEPSIRFNAITVISARNSEILTAICESGELSQIAQDILNGDIQADLTVLGPFCQTIEICISELPSQFESSFPFVPGLLLLCEHDPIYRLLEAVLSMSEIAVVRYLAAHGFVQSLIRRLRDDCDEMCVEKLYSLLLLCAKNWALAIDCGSPAGLSFIVGQLEEIGGPIQAIQWKLLLELINGDRLDVMRSALFEAIALISIENAEKICEFQVNALNFVRAFYSLDEKSAREIDNQKLISAVANWFGKFPGHTIAMEAVCRFMEIAVVIPGLGEYVGNSFLPLVIAAEGQPNNRVQMSFAIRWVRQIALIADSSNSAADLISRPEVRMFRQINVAEVDRILGIEYGRNGGHTKVPLAMSPTLGFDHAQLRV
jgi:hypothetical protein